MDFLVSNMRIVKYIQYFDLACKSIVSHPLVIVKALTRVGYELVQPPETPTLGFDFYFFYPNPFGLGLSLIHRRGVPSLWRGVRERVAVMFAERFIHDNLSQNSNLAQWLAMRYPGVDRAWMESAQDAVSKLVTTVVIHPLRVVVLRKVLQLVGEQEVLGHSPFSVVRDIYRQEGLLGFFSGLTPALLFALLRCGVSTYIRRTYYVFDDQPRGKTMEALRKRLWRRWLLPLTWLLKSLTVVSTVMMAGPAWRLMTPGDEGRGAPLPRGCCTSTTTWVHCLLDLLLRQKRLFRGYYFEAGRFFEWVMLLQGHYVV